MCSSDLTVSPNNPTGAVYSEASLRALNALCRERGVFHIHDEAYEYFTYDHTRNFSAGSIAGAAGHTISLYSLSKGYGMASWRVGFMVIPEALWPAVNKIQDTLLICNSQIAQRVAVECLGNRIHRVRVFYGFMDEPNLPDALEWCAEQGLQVDMADTSFFLGRETLIPKAGSEMALWRERLFVAMSKNAGSAADYFRQIGRAHV